MVNKNLLWSVASVMLLTSLFYVVDAEINLLPSWTFGRNRVGNQRARTRSRAHSVIRPRGNCATYIDTSEQPVCAADQIVFFDLETCRLACGAADRLTEDTQNAEYQRLG